MRLEMKKPHHVMDARCMVGRHLALREDGPHTAAQLLSEMDHHGIAEALVIDCLSRECHPADGNARVLEVCKASPRLHPAWAALPPGTSDEQPAPVELLRQMRLNRVGALYILPGQYAHNLSDWCLDALLEPLAADGVPVIIVPNDTGPYPPAQWDETDWDGVVRLCRRFPRLPVIVSELRIRRAQRLIYRALDACGNLRIELSGYWLSRGIEYVTRRWGSERLIFGSNWPVYGQHMTIACLNMAEIGDEDRRRIAGGNMRELMSWCAPKHVTVKPKPAADEFVELGRTGVRPRGMKKFHDCHGHFGKASHYHLPHSTVEQAIDEMDRTGVEKCLLFNFSGIFSDDVFGNDVIARVIARYPDRFVGLTLLNPNRGRLEMIRELKRCAKLGFRGIKLIAHYQAYPQEGPLIDVACEWAHDHGQIILNHNWGSSAQMERLVSTYPDACFIVGHAPFAYPEYVEIMKLHKNIHVCSCALPGPKDCEHVVADMGADRLLFGSDLLDLPIAWGLGPILFARISRREKRMILGGNLQKILKRYSGKE